MAVLSKKQAAKLKAEKESKKAVAAGPEIKVSGPAVTPPGKWLWTFLFPESEEGAAHNFTNKVMIDGQEHEFVCVNNKVETRDVKTAEYLGRNQYILFAKKEI